LRDDVEAIVLAEATVIYHVVSRAILEPNLDPRRIVRDTYLAGHKSGRMVDNRWGKKLEFVKLLPRVEANASFETLHPPVTPILKPIIKSAFAVVNDKSPANFDFACLVQPPI